MNSGHESRPPPDFNFHLSPKTVDISHQYRPPDGENVDVSYSAEASVPSRRRRVNLPRSNS
jgi:hypothetical protein